MKQAKEQEKRRRQKVRPFIRFQNPDGTDAVPLYRHRVFVGNDVRRNFVEIYVWRHLWEVRALRNRKAPHRSKTLAFFNEYAEVATWKNKRGGEVGSRKLGDVHFAWDRMSYDTVAHECYHVVRCYARRSGNVEPSNQKQADAEFVDGADCAEERNASFAGFLTGRVIRECLRFADEQAKTRNAKRRRQRK